MGLRVASQENPLALNKAAGQPDSRLPGRGVCGPAVAAASRRLSGTKRPHTVSCKRRPTQLICGGSNRRHYCKPAALGTRSRSLPRLETCICCHGFCFHFTFGMQGGESASGVFVSSLPPFLPSASSPSISPLTPLSVLPVSLLLLFHATFKMHASFTDGTLTAFEEHLKFKIS